MKKVLAIGFAAMLAIGVTGCAAFSAGEPTPTPTPTATLPAAMTPAEAKAAYKDISEASCNKAQAEGVVETGADFTAVMTPKSQNYKDYSAAYFVAPDDYGLIWELDGLTSCADWYTFSMADEAGQEAAIDVTFNPADGTFTTVEDFGENGIYTYVFTVADGRISTATNVVEDGKVTTITYGALDAASLKILTEAVERFLAKD